MTKQLKLAVCERPFVKGVTQALVPEWSGYDLDREVRKHLKNLSEGTESFEIEYQKKLDAIRRKHGLND